MPTFELDGLAANFVEALVRNKYTDLAEEFAAWWEDNRPDLEDDYDGD